ncbi:C-factor [Lachnellula occidentalis]|uniref:C-factor n=1 Tax=Lachnellula occidentalis TaxID=215460 RepID=A0A8H8RPP7_9HELO|nr:C-factor [Lachnellula occidentalis]
MGSYLITGASRGLGFEMTRQLVSLPVSQVNKVFATTRADAPGLNEIAQKSDGRLVVIKLDVSKEATIKEAAEEVEAHLVGKGLDVLINNAGTMLWSPNGVVTMDNLEETFMTNVLGVHWVTQAFFSLLQKGNLKKFANITSTLGSIAMASQYAAGPSPAYKISKTALNSLTVQYALGYEKEGFTFLLSAPVKLTFCLEYLKTDLGSQNADLDVDVGAKATLDKILGAGREQNGQFLNIHVKGWEEKEGPNRYDGVNPPW